jgi:hypothetical protein
LRLRAISTWKTPVRGHFHCAVVKGLRGKGSITAQRQISTKELSEFVINGIEQLAGAQSAEHET